MTNAASSLSNPNSAETSLICGISLDSKKHAKQFPKTWAPKHSKKAFSRQRDEIFRHLTPRVRIKDVLPGGDRHVLMRQHGFGAGDEFPDEDDLPYLWSYVINPLSARKFRASMAYSSSVPTIVGYSWLWSPMRMVALDSMIFDRNGLYWKFVMSYNSVKAESVSCRNGNIPCSYMD